MPKNYAFVSVNDPDSFKNEENRCLVQSHVGRFNRDKSKLSRRNEHKDRERLNMLAEMPARNIKPRPKPDRMRNQYGGPNNESSFIPATSKSVPVAGLIRILPVSQQMHYGSAPTESLAYSSATEPTNDEDSSDERVLHLNWKTYMSRLLGQGRVDPFARWPVETDDSKLHISGLIDHAVSGFWSRLTPGREYGQTNPVNHVYLSHMAYSKIAFYCYTIVISHHYDFLSDLSPATKTYRSLRAKHLHVATRMVRQYIESLPANPQPEQIPDELIGCVISLSANYRINIVDRRACPQSRFKSPLAKLQCLDMWGLLPLLPPHRIAVVQLVRMKGGLHMLDKNVAGVVQLDDLLDASRYLTKPMLPWSNLGAPLPAPSWPLKDNAMMDQSIPVSTSMFLSVPSTIIQFGDLNLAISAIGHTTHLLTDYLSTGCQESSMALLMESRNCAQHRALNLPTAFYCPIRESSRPVRNEQSIESLSISEKHIYEIIRLALLVFNNLVVYPLPPFNGLDTRLARLLKDEIYAALIYDDSLKTRYADLLLWALILGGISDYYDLLRTWYVETAREILETRPELREWLRTEQLLTGFLWLDFVLSGEAMKFWIEVAYPHESRG